MGRSHKRNPFAGITTAQTEKTDKRIANRRLRALSRQAVQAGSEVLPLLREVSNVWSFDKDGKTRLDPTRDPRRLRK